MTAFLIDGDLELFVDALALSSSPLDTQMMRPGGRDWRGINGAREESISIFE